MWGGDCALKRERRKKGERERMLCLYCSGWSKSPRQRSAQISNIYGLVIKGEVHIPHMQSKQCTTLWFSMMVTPVTKSDSLFTSLFLHSPFHWQLDRLILCIVIYVRFLKKPTYYYNLVRWITGKRTNSAVLNCRGVFKVSSSPIKSTYPILLLVLHKKRSLQQTT